MKDYNKDIDLKRKIAKACGFHVHEPSYPGHFIVTGGIGSAHDGSYKDAGFVVEELMSIINQINADSKTKANLEAQLAYEAGLETYDIDKIKAKAKLDGAIEELGGLPLDCGNCGKRTTYLEADLRNFNTGMCAACGADALAISFRSLATLKEERSKL